MKDGVAMRALEEAEPLQGNGQGQGPGQGQQQAQQQQQSTSMLAFASSTTGRRWPLLAVLLAVVLLASSSPWLYSQLVPSDYDYETTGPDLGLTVQDMIYDPNHIDHSYTLDQAEHILNCTYRKWRPKLKKPVAQPGVCPKYFQLIQKDLAPWKDTGITRQNVEMAKRGAFGKLSIVDNKLYVDRWRNCFGTRSVFTMWGLLLLLEKFKGQVPNVEFMFNCEDRPRMPAWENTPEGPMALFSYNTRSDHLDIPFPDFSLWGWPELRIHSWDDQRNTIMKGSQKQKWEKKVPNAFWSGNPNVGAPHRRELMKCNHNKLTDIHAQEWAKEIATGKRNSNLDDQCTHKYMIYTEGNAWSVSFKYILACGSPVLILSPAFYDFFSRGLQENVDYVPVRPPALVAPAMCQAIDAAVKAGEKNQSHYLKIGQTGQAYMNDEVSMDMVYNYMYHLLVEYSKLLKFKPEVSAASHLVSLDHFKCLQPPLETGYLHRVMELLPTNSVPCTMPEVPAGEKPFQGYRWEIIRPF